MHASELFDIEDLFAAIDGGYVRVNKHPELPLSLYVYTEKAQFENVWTPVTMACRGLVLEDETFEIVGLPLGKFFNSNQHGGYTMRDGQLELNEWAPPLPDEPFQIFEKVDGSMITIFNYQGQWIAASKGSFTSDQAKWAQQRIKGWTGFLFKKLTYIAEAVYPENRIVLDYGDREDLVLLAVRRNVDGYEADLNEFHDDWAGIGSVVKGYMGMVSRDFLTHLERFASEGKDLNGDKRSGVEEEGYVIRFWSGVRAKVKLADYLQAHKLFTQTNERTVHGWLATGQELSGILALVPDEYAEWVKEVASDFERQHAHLVSDVFEAFREITDVMTDEQSRKEFAAMARRFPWPSPLFLLYDGRDITGWAWKQLEPKGQTASAFSNKEE